MAARKQLTLSEKYDRAREAELRAELRELTARRELEAAEEAVRTTRDAREAAYIDLKASWQSKEGA